MIGWSSTQMSNRVPTTSMCVDECRQRRCVHRKDYRTRCGCREIFILQDVPNHVGELDVRANRELADPIRILIGVRVVPKGIFELAVLRKMLRSTGSP